MRLLVISHTPHHWSEGRLVGWGPTVREIDRLASLFDELVHVAPVHSGKAPESELLYEAENVRVVAVPAAGGESLGQKLAVLRMLPHYVRTVWRELGKCDGVHVRCPSNIGLISVLLLLVRRTPSVRWIKYAGNWRPRGAESWSYRLQRWVLEGRLTRSRVTVNGRWPNQPPHVHSFLNPCLTGEELREGIALAHGKTLDKPVRLLFVGRVDREKGCGRAIDILAGLRAAGVTARLDVIGDGPDRDRFESQAAAARLSSDVHFHGWLPRPSLADFYAKAHFLLLPSSSSEGWPKVLSEGMAYGVVPMTSDVSSIPQLIAAFGSGRALDANDQAAFVEAIAGYVRNPDLWKSESRNAAKAASAFTYASYLSAVRDLLDLEVA